MQTTKRYTGGVKERTRSTGEFFQRGQKGQAAVEFALILPVLLALLFGIIEMARLLQSYLVVTNAARFGMR